MMLPIMEKSPKAIADSVIKLAITLNKDLHDVTISNIITRKYIWNSKVDDVNKYLAELCKKNNVFLLDNLTSIKV